MAKSLNSPMVSPVGSGKVPAIAANTFVNGPKITQPQMIKFDGKSRELPGSARSAR
jgi:hypothetical protein